MKRSWYNIAKERQIKYKQQVLGLSEKGEHGQKQYENILSIKDCENGRNFYCHKDSEVWQCMRSWYKASSGKKLGYQKSTLRNMLRSEHIAFNIIYPLVVLRQSEPDKLVKIIQAIISKRTTVQKITDIRIEYTPDTERLNDKTSFDAYIEYLTLSGKKGALGIEVKYTEKSYPSNAKQKRELEDEDSIYNRLSTGANSYYVEGANLKLRAKKLKQPWRNHLMGIALVAQEPKLLDEFFSVHLYPKENTYQADVCKEYLPLLKDDRRDTFIPLTFEDFAEECRSVIGEAQWLDYFEERYLA